MNITALPFLLALALVSSSIAQSPTPSPDITTREESLDQATLKRRMNFGYSDEEIKKYFSKPQVFEFDTTGLATPFNTPPAPGIHPRVLFYQEDLPALRKKLSDTKPGKLQMDGIRATLSDLITGPKAKYGKLYEDAVNGIENKQLGDVEPACAIEYECFRCLIDNDAAGAKKASAALTTLAKVANANLDESFAKADQKAAERAAKPATLPSTGGPLPETLAPGYKPFRDYQETKTMTQAGLLGLAYDFVYPWMSDAQRDVVRGVIAKASANMTCIGAEGLPAFPANTSNWIPMHMRLILLTLSIEGEKGYDPTTYDRCVSAYKRYLGPGLFPAGDMFESMGKNFICTENLIPLANRGEPLVTLKNLRNQIDYFYLHAMDPWGGHFTFYDSLGGRRNSTPMFDVMVQKHLFPNDPAIDFVYRNTVGDDYKAFTGKVHFGHPFHLNDGIVMAIFGEPYDESKTWDQAKEAATAGKPLTFFSEDTGNLITLSSWSKDALQLHFLTRCVAGGHIYCDRTHFSIHALGRYWGIYKPLRQVEEHYSPRNRSVVLIDGKGPGMAPSKCIDFVDTPEATFIAADSVSSYNWTTGGNNRFPKGGVPVPFCANDFRLHKSTLPWMDMPYSDLPYWQTSMKGSEQWLSNNTVQSAFRSSGLVRGEHPYALVVDDIQQDSTPHEYQWGMILEDDLVQDSIATESTAEGFRSDIIVKAPGDTRDRSLLVRVLNAEGLADPKVPASIESFKLPNPPQKEIELHRLSVVSKAVNPRFKMLLFPFEKGTELPKTLWNTDRTQLTIKWADQTDIITFQIGADGRTRYSITRQGKELISLK